MVLILIPLVVAILEARLHVIQTWRDGQRERARAAAEQSLARSLSMWSDLQRLASTPPVSSPESTAAWQIVVQVAGAATGLAAFVYLIGAVTIWVRLRVARFPADVGLNLMPESEVAAVGVRGVVVIALIVAPALLAVGYITRKMSGSNRNLSKRFWIVTGVLAGLDGAVIFAAFGSRGLLTFSSFLAVGVAGLSVGQALASGDGRSRWKRLLLGGSAGTAMVLAAFVSWRVLGVVTTILAATTLVTVLATRRDGLTRASRWILVVGLLVAVGIGALAWQVQAPVRITQVFVEPPLFSGLEGIPVPYFGETDGFVYVAEIVRPRPGERFPYRYTHTILEVKRSDISSLKFPGVQARLYPTIDTPASLVGHWLSALWNATNFGSKARS